MLYICPCKITTLTNRRTRGHYKSQGYGQLNMKANDVNKVQKAVKKYETETLTGAVKAWCRLFSSSKDVMGIIKENNIEVPKDIIPALVALAKDKELVITICKEILANIDGVFCQYIEIEKIYNDENESVNNKVMLAEKQAQKIIWVQRIKPLAIVLLLNTLRIKAVISLFTITKDINLLEWLRE